MTLILIKSISPTSHQRAMKCWEKLFAYVILLAYNPFCFQKFQGVGDNMKQFNVLYPQGDSVLLENDNRVFCFYFI